MTQQPPERDGLSEEGVLHGKHIELLLVIERDLARALSGATEVDEVLRLSLKAGMDATGLQCGGVYLVDSESNVLRLECHAGLSPEFIREVAVFGPNTDEFRLVALAEVAQIDSQSNPPPAFLSARRAGMQAVIVVPVIHDGRPIGSMNLGSPTLNRIAPSVRHVLDTIASQMCVALVRVRSEAAHRSVQAELRAIYDGSPTMMCVLDRDLRLQYLNRTMAEFIGKNEKELQHQRACGIIGCINALDDPRGCGHGPKCEACTMRLAMINTLHTGESHRGVERRMTLMRGESQNDVVLLGATVLIPSRAGASLLLCLEDITERKRTEDALQESEMKFRQLIERSSDVFYRQSLRSGLFEYISPKVHALLGYTPDEVMNLDLEMQEAQIHPDDIESLARFSIDLVQADEEGQPCIEREFRLRNKQGTYRWLHGNYALVRDSDGSPHLIVGSLRDVTERKQAEEHLRLKSLVLDQISDHVTVTDLNGRITYVNQAQVDTLQRSSRELIGQPTELFGEDACRGATQQQIVELTLRNGSWRGEVVNYAADGSERIMDCRTQVILAADGIPIALAGVATDITRRRLTEDALRESQARLAESNQLLTAVLEHTHMMAVFLDPRFNFVWVNRAYADTCRHEPSYFPGKNHFHLYPNEENKAIFQRVADTGRPFFVAAKPFVFPDQPERGTTYWDWSLIPVKDADGKVAGLVFTLAEVTERFRAEAALRHEKSYTESILRSMADMLVVVAPDGSIVTVNESTCRTSGYRERDLLGQPATLLLEEEEEEEDPNVTLASHALPVKRSLLRHLIIRGFVTGIQGSMRTKHGRQVPVVFSGAVMYGTQNEIRGIVCLLRDITTRIENEAKLRSLESQLNHAARLASLGELAAGIAHEVNQPLCSIVNYAKACTNLASSDQAQDLGQIREWADMIAATAADTGDIVRRVIHFARRSLPDREEFRLRELVDDAILLVSQEAQARGVMITTSIPKNGVSVHVQSVAVQQVLVNVLRNSIEALGTMPSMDRRIHIGAAPFDRLVEVVVSDNGPGLPEDQRASIFEPFVTTKPQGLGLGLSICRTIVEEHGGSIWVTARDMGGAIVHFTLPARPG